MEIVNICVENTLRVDKNYPCPADWNATKAIERIQREHGLVDGAIRRNGVPLDDEDIPFSSFIQDGDVLRFVNGKKIFIII